MRAYGGCGRVLRSPPIDVTAVAVMLLEQAADAMDRDGRPEVADSHRHQAQALRDDIA